MGYLFRNLFLATLLELQMSNSMDSARRCLQELCFRVSATDLSQGIHGTVGHFQHMVHLYHQWWARKPLGKPGSSGAISRLLGPEEGAHLAASGQLHALVHLLGRLATRRGGPRRGWVAPSHSGLVGVVKSWRNTMVTEFN